MRPRTVVGRGLLGLAALAAAACATVGADPPREATEARGATPADAAARAKKELAARLPQLDKRVGLLTLYLDAEQGRVWLELPTMAAEAAPAAGGDDPPGTLGSFLYVEGLVTGLGSNPVGLDRGQLGETRVVRLRRLADRLLVEEPNLRFRARSDDPHERRATRESFASSVLWAGPVIDLGDGRPSLVDLTTFVVRDAHGVSATLERTGQGSYKLDRERSVVDLEACLAFPDNVELEALLTWAGEKPGPHLRATAPTPEAVSLVQHHSLVRLPDDRYGPRPFDPRAGSFAIEFADYAAPLDRPVEQRWIVRHRLEKADPAAERSPAVEPLVYYVDRAIPEPVRGAVVDGVGWWAAAFEAAGFEDAFRVELMPEGAHPLDVRYNFVEWVHRSTRGWSYGGGITDPRTGEMIKGHVSLGSLRVRQDRLLLEGLVGTERTGSGDADDPVQVALARIRQLAAHEVGHTLGLAHNFAASTYGRASVMDYPAPLVGLSEAGALDLSEAYGVGVGAWDLHAVRYAYSQPEPGVEEADLLAGVVRRGLEEGLLFLSDADARPPGAAQPVGSLWDNGSDPVAQLRHDLEVRRIALERFGAANVAEGQPLALLEERLATLYFHHRYQLEAAVKVLGGLDYRYAVRGDGQPGARALSGEAQREALVAVLEAMAPAALDLPEELLALLLPRPFGYPPHRELFRGASAPAFDPVGAAATAADLAVSHLLQRERAARLVDFQRRDAGLPGLTDVLEALAGRLEPESGETPRQAEIRRAVGHVVVARTLDLAGDEANSPAVRAAAEWGLDLFATRLETFEAGLAPGASGERAYAGHLRRRISRFLERRDGDGAVRVAGDLPPGPPIGAADGWPAQRMGCAFAEAGGR